MTGTLREALDRIAASAVRPEAWVEEEGPLRAWLRDPATEAVFRTAAGLLELGLPTSGR